MTIRVAGVAAAMLLVPTVSAHAAGDLYEAVVLVTGQHADNRPDALARAFREDLVKISGDSRLADDPRVAAMATAAGDYVTGYAYRDLMAGVPLHDEQGTRQRPYALTVSFNPEKIDALLASLGVKPWTDRPPVLVDVAVINGDVRFDLAADGSRGRDMRDALAAEARRMGMVAVLPGNAPPDAVTLAGTLTWDAAALGWTAAWSFDDDAGAHAWRISGVSFDAAFRNGLRGVAVMLSGNGDPD